MTLGSTVAFSLLKSIFEFPKITAANEGLGPGQEHNAVDFGLNNRGVSSQFFQSQRFYLEPVR